MPQPVVNDEFWQTDTCHLVIGCDSSQLINQVLQHGVPDGSVYLFIEPDDRFAQSAAQCSPDNRWAGKIALCTRQNWLSQAEAFAIDTFLLKQKVLIQQGSASTANADYNALLSQQVLTQLEEKALAVRSGLAEKELIIKTLDNLADNLQPIVSLKDLFNGKTAMVLGAAPSLKDHIEWIKRVRDNVVIIAASRLCHYLHEEELYPDMVVSIDHQPINFELSKDIFKLPESTILLHSNHVSTQLLAQWAGPKFYIGELFPWDCGLNIDNLQDATGPTVANTGLVAAESLGFDRAILCGVDLCSLLGSASHVGSDCLQEHSNRTHEVMTYSQQPAYTNVHMAQAAQVLASQVSKFKRMRVYNISASARQISGIDYLDPEQIKWTETVPANWIEQLLSTLNTDTTNIRQQIMRELDRARKQADVIISLAGEARVLNKKIYKKDSAGNYNLKAKRKLDTLQQRLDTEFQAINIPIKKIGTEWFIASLTTRDMNAMSDSELEAIGDTYYKAYKRSAKLLKSVIERSLVRVESRIEEDQKKPDIDRLLRQWNQDYHPGRAVHWLQQHTTVAESLSEDQQREMAALKQWFESLLERGNTNHIVGPRVPMQITSVEVILELLNLRDLTALQKLRESLEKIVTYSQQNKHHYHLVMCCLGLLSEDNRQVLHHLPLIPPHDLSEGLAQTMLSLVNNDPVMTEKILQQLAQQDERYMPRYARVLNANNRILEAIDVFTQYLQSHTEDVDTWLALAEIYKNHEERELAAAVYAYVLERDPNNTTAKAFMI